MKSDLSHHLLDQADGLDPESRSAAGGPGG